MINNNKKHISVMLKEVINFLNIKPNGIYIDCTLGLAGHSKIILSKLTSGKLYAFEHDQNAINNSNSFLKKHQNKFNIIKSNFINIKSELFKKNITKVDGILYDLGISSIQVDNSNRGFSYMKEAKLDMRMNQNQQLNAWYIVNNYNYDQLKKILKIYGEEYFASNIAKNIIKERNFKNINTTLELVAIIKKSLPLKLLNKKHHPAKKTFQALRITVNNELENLKSSLKQSLDLLNLNGRIVVISFHSLEDRIVKHIFKDVLIDPQARIYSKLPIVNNWKKKYEIITKKPIKPTFEEIKNNPRSRSAKLRVISRIDL